MASLLTPPVVMDCGTGYTKLGFAGNTEPSWVIPTAVGFPPSSTGQPSTSSMRYCVGEDATSQAADIDVVYPVKSGVVENWDCMERLWEQCIWQLLRVNPEDHSFILTEPPLNPPEKREATAEIMFETFNVAGLHIGVQAVLALYAGSAAGDKGTVPKAQGAGLTGTVIDSGDGCTHVIPVCDGYVVGSAIKSVPMAGRDITRFVQQLMRERGEPLPPVLSLDVARRIKERHCYVCSDMVNEFDKHDGNPGKYIQRYQGADPKTNEPFECSVAYERFLGPEVFFNPEIYGSEWHTPLPVLVDEVVRRCPIDARRRLYGNVVLSGGSTMFKDFGRRLQRDVKRIVDARLGGPGPNPAIQYAGPPAPSAGGMSVCVVSHPLQRYAVWFGGSIVGCMPDFGSICATKAMYEEIGPSVVRNSRVFQE